MGGFDYELNKNNMAGWVKLHRQLLEWEWSTNPAMFSLFTHLLLLANHETKKWQGQTILPGQLVTGRNSLSKVTGLTPQCLRTCITRLKSTNEITIKSTNRFTIITIVKWDQYQSNQDESTKSLTSKSTFNQPATNQQITTNKNEKNYKNEKKLSKTPLPPTGDGEGSQPEQSTVAIEMLEDYLARTGEPKVTEKTRYRHLQAIDQLIELTFDALELDGIETTEENIKASVQWRFDQLEKQWPGKWTPSTAVDWFDRISRTQ